MKKTAKRLLAFLLAVVIVCGTFAFGASAAEEKIVARVSVVCLVRTPGHMWIYVENLTNKSMKVGAYTLPKNGGVSIGTFGPTRYDGYGIYYNVESYCYTEYGMSGYKSLTEDLTAAELKTLSDGILSYRNSWGPFRNCVAFASQMWNLNSEKKLSNLIFPAFANLQMTFKGAITDNPMHKAVTAAKVYRQYGTGADAYLERVSDRSLGDLS
ncbi:MAG: hypothetical protein IKY78_08545 [Clostridia bacterium]|nr:hypothetical protein [Clostridia bacterium]